MPDDVGSQQTTRDLAPADRSVAVDIVRTVSDALGTAPDDLRPLETVVDTDALQSLAADGATISFVYENCEITLATGDTLRVDPPRQHIP